MDLQSLKKLLNDSPDYAFLRTEDRLKGRIGLLCLGGSLAYGTNLDSGGDIDLRGIYFERPRELIGLSTETLTYEDKVTDTKLYAFNKFLTLAMECNPNSLELLGVLDAHCIEVHPLIQLMFDNKEMFLSRRAITSFGDYAKDQLRRLELAIAKDRVSQSRKEEYVKQSLESAMRHFAGRYTSFEHGSMALSIGPSKKEGFDTEVFIDIDLRHYPVRDLNSIMNELTNVARTYNNNNRNKKKSVAQLDKHAMHLVRLYFMAFDILERHLIKTYRDDPKERELLLSIRNGAYRLSDATYSDAFFELRRQLDERLQYDANNTDLPKLPDIERINQYKMEVNRQIVTGSV